MIIIIMSMETVKPLLIGAIKPLLQGVSPSLTQQTASSHFLIFFFLLFLDGPLFTNFPKFLTPFFFHASSCLFFVVPCCRVVVPVAGRVGFSTIDLSLIFFTLRRVVVYTTIVVFALVAPLNVGSGDDKAAVTGCIAIALAANCLLAFFYAHPFLLLDGPFFTSFPKFLTPTFVFASSFLFYGVVPFSDKVDPVAGFVGFSTIDLSLIFFTLRRVVVYTMIVVSAFVALERIGCKIRVKHVFISAY